MLKTYSKLYKYQYINICRPQVKQYPKVFSAKWIETCWFKYNVKHIFKMISLYFIDSKLQTAFLHSFAQKGL